MCALLPRAAHAISVDDLPIGSAAVLDAAGGLKDEKRATPGEMEKRLTTASETPKQRLADKQKETEKGKWTAYAIAGLLLWLGIDLAFIVTGALASMVAESFHIPLWLAAPGAGLMAAAFAIGVDVPQQYVVACGVVCTLLFIPFVSIFDEKYSSKGRKLKRKKAQGGKPPRSTVYEYVLTIFWGILFLPFTVLLLLGGGSSSGGSSSGGSRGSGGSGSYRGGGGRFGGGGAGGGW